MSLALAFLLNYFVFLCSIMNSPLTTSITGERSTLFFFLLHELTTDTGQLKNILSTVLGLFLFGGVVLTPSLTVGLLMSTIAGCWYGYVKYEEKMEAVKREGEKDIRAMEEGKRTSN
jgi:hypothetical protein